MTKQSRQFVGLFVALGLALSLPACGFLSSEGESSYPGSVGGDRYSPTGKKDKKRDTGFGDDDDSGGFVIFGDGGLFGGGSKKREQVASIPQDPGAPALPQISGGGIGVNPYLWRASLDTISFMPLASADPFGGVIITDWYSDPQAPSERFKITIYILDQQLRADGVRVSVFRQEKDFSGNWKDAGINPDVSGKLENAILVRARELKVATGG